jgi:ABC-type uncharacterized transport system ATPase component
VTAGLPGTAKIIEARDLFLSFGSTPALRGAALGVHQGEIVAVMGPGGSGKSTLLHCLAGILVPEEGQVWFGGQRLDTLSDDRRSALRRDRFGFVFQSGQLAARCKPCLTSPHHAIPRSRSAPRGLKPGEKAAYGPGGTASAGWLLDPMFERKDWLQCSDRVVVAAVRSS